jgi:hypothetical protein
MKKEANKINSTEDRCHSNVPEHFRQPLMKVAYKLLSRDEATFEELTPTEQQLWNSFETNQIYRPLTGEPDMVPEFRFNWYTVTGGDAMIEFIPLLTGATSARPSPTTTAVPAAKVQMPKTFHPCLHLHQLQARLPLPQRPLLLVPCPRQYKPSPHQGLQQPRVNHHLL